MRCQVLRRRMEKKNIVVSYINHINIFFVFKTCDVIVISLIMQFLFCSMHLIRVGYWSVHSLQKKNSHFYLF
jgi:hypothetical protein